MAIPEKHMKLITIKVFENAIDAHILKTKLESEGIPAILVDENIVTLNPLYNIAVGGGKLQVRDEDFGRANMGYKTKCIII